MGPDSGMLPPSISLKRKTIDGVNHLFLLITRQTVMERQAIADTLGDRQITVPAAKFPSHIGEVLRGTVLPSASQSDPVPVCQYG